MIPLFETAVVFTGHMGYPGGRWCRVCYVAGDFEVPLTQGSVWALSAIEQMDPGSYEWQPGGLDYKPTPPTNVERESPNMVRAVSTHPVLRVGTKRFFLTPFDLDSNGIVIRH